MIVDKELVVSNRKKADIVADLRKKGFRPFPKVNRAGETEQVVEADEGDVQEETSADYDYLLGMAIWSLTKEKVHGRIQLLLLSSAELRADREITTSSQAERSGATGAAQEDSGADLERRS